MKRICIALFPLVFSIFAAIAHAQVTSLSMTGDPGDFVLGGQTKFLTPADGTFFVSQNFDNGVSMNFNGNNSNNTFEFWLVDFAAPGSQPLTIGTYTGATRFPFQAFNEPGLSIAGDGAGCNTVTGSFTVLEINYAPGGGIDSFDATFEQHCEGASPALRGEFRFNAHPELSVFAPGRLNAIENRNTHFTVTATDASSRHVVLSAAGVPAGASFIDNGDNTGTFDWTPTASQAGDYFVTFTGDNLSGNTGLAVTHLIVIPPPPPNDDFNTPTVISSIPFTMTENVANATVAPDDPFCFSRNQTVWFSFTPTQNIRLEVNTFGSNYDTTLSVYTGARGTLTSLGCSDDVDSTPQSRVRFDAVAGTTYYFEVSSFFSVFGPNLVLNLLKAPPPLAIVPSITQFGSVDPSTGTATISGFVSCTQPAFVTLFGQLKQTRGGTPIGGFFSVFVPCNGTTPWTANIQTTGVTLFHGRAADLFTGGKADISASASAFDPDNGGFIEKNLAVTITLRGKQ